MAKRSKAKEPETVSEEQNTVKEDTDNEFDKPMRTDVGTSKLKADDALRLSIQKITTVHPTKLNASELQLANKISQYVETMSPVKRTTIDVGVLMQKRLNTVILQMLDLEDDRFTLFMDWFMKVIRESRAVNGAFADKYILRYMSFLDIPQKQSFLFQRFINLLLLTAELKDKRVLKKKVDISYILNGLSKENAKNKLMRYYN